MADNYYSISCTKLVFWLAIVFVCFSQFSGSGLAHRYGYEAPELSDSAVYTDKCDVYSFGVVMLELLTGRKAYDRYKTCLILWICFQFSKISINFLFFIFLI